MSSSPFDTGAFKGGSARGKALKDLLPRVTANEIAIASNVGDIITLNALLAALDARVVADVADLVVALLRVTANESGIASNLTTIVGHTTELGALTPRVATAELDILVNMGSIAALATRIGVTEADLVTLFGLTTALDGRLVIAENSIAANAIQIVANLALLGVHSTDITTNASNIGVNSNLIAANSLSIATNSAGIAQNVIGISTNAADISLNAANIASNLATIVQDAFRITANEGGIAGNAANILTNTSNITLNAADIAANTLQVAANLLLLGTHTADILSNTSGVAANTSSIVANASAIAVNATDITANTSSITANGSAISSLLTNMTQAQLDIVNLLTRMIATELATTTNTTDITNLTTRMVSAEAILGTTSAGVANLTGRVTTNEVAIALNTLKNSYPTVDATKLAGIEVAATADQTGAEIKAALYLEPDTNNLTDALTLKLTNLKEGYVGYFANVAALVLAYPVGSVGQFATLGDTDTIWSWDDATVAWLNTDSNTVGDMLKAIYDPTSINGDAFARGNHTGTQLAATISDLTSAIGSHSVVAASTLFYDNSLFNNSATVDLFIAQLVAKGAFNSNSVVFKVKWYYAANSNLVTGHPTIGTIELAGCVIETWGNAVNKHIRITRPNSGVGGHGVYEYNDQGSPIYNPEWREIWTSESDGAGSGLDADLLDGLQGSDVLARANHTGTQLASTISDLPNAIASDANVLGKQDIRYNSATNGKPSIIKHPQTMLTVDGTVPSYYVVRIATAFSSANLMLNATLELYYYTNPASKVVINLGFYLLAGLLYQTTVHLYGSEQGQYSSITVQVGKDTATGDLLLIVRPRQGVYHTALKLLELHTRWAWGAVVADAPITLETSADLVAFSSLTVLNLSYEGSTSLQLTGGTLTGNLNGRNISVDGAKLDTLTALTMSGATKAALVAVADWNNYLVTGFYRGVNLLNSPAALGAHNWRYILVTNHGGAWCLQEMTDFKNVASWTRVLLNGTWSSWVRTDATYALDRTLHTGTQLASTISDLAAAIAADVTVVANITNIATVTALANAIDASLTAHLADGANPHAVTAAQVGALPLTGGTLIGTLNGRDISADGAKLDTLAAHALSTANPHGVTAVQVGALSLAGGTLTGDLAITGLVDGRDVAVDGAKLDAIVAPYVWVGTQQYSNTFMAFGNVLIEYQSTPSMGNNFILGTQDFYCTQAGYYEINISQTMQVAGGSGSSSKAYLRHIDGVTGATTTLANMPIPTAFADVVHMYVLHYFAVGDRYEIVIAPAAGLTAWVYARGTGYTSTHSRKRVG